MSGRAKSYLHAAREAARWVIAARMETPRGPRWPTVVGDPETIDSTLFGAEAGIAIFLADLATVTSDAEVTAGALSATSSLAATPDDGRFGLYSGYAGMVFAVHHAAAVLGDDRLLDQADRMLDHLVDAAVPTGMGLEWPAWHNGRGPWQELSHGTAGTALVAARLGRLDAAAAGGRRLVELALPASTGKWWRSRPDDFKPAPNMAHGTAGIAYSLATLALATGDPEFGEAALDGAAYLLSIARTDGGTCGVYHHEVDGTNLYMLGFCSGSTGLGCLFVRLYQLTGDSTWLDWTARAARTVTTSGLPARLYPGFWDNVGQCCGSAGVADFFLGLHALTGDSAHLRFAVTVLDDILDRAVVDEQGMRWHNIEPTATPPTLPAQTG